MKCEIEGEEIVVRVPLEVLVTAMPYAWSQRYGWGDENMKVVDSRQFAEAVVDELTNESEDGSTLLTNALDDAMIKAIEQGCEGVGGFEE